MSTILILGATGLVGQQILALALEDEKLAALLPLRDKSLPATQN
jgi:uncharacterized protein YbjT (DUF2867 family)